MATGLAKLGVLLALWTVSVHADYDCACNYNVEKAVYPSPDLNHQPLGYLYEFDCKAISDGHSQSPKFLAIQFERKLGYVEVDNQVQRQTCGGDPSPGDLIPSTAKPHGTTLPPAVNGQWSDWAEWAQCTTSCGDGQRSRTRSCSSPAPSHGGQPCSGSDKEDTQCDNGPCPIDGAWSGWLTWAACSVSCEAGTRTRNRTCTNPAPDFDGKPCEGVSTDSGACNDGPCPVDGAWSEWQSWSPCSVTCSEGRRTRNRTCSNPSPAHGGDQCPGFYYEDGSCQPGLCPVDGSWTGWTTWSVCSTTCGGGKHTRNRTCTFQDGYPKGADCFGDDSEWGTCNTNMCPVDGRWSMWAAWSSCSVTCGGGTHTRDRLCEFDPRAPHGANCVGESSQSGSCNTNLCPVDGQWSSWTAWSSCSVTCGGGNHTRLRQCEFATGHPHGANCVGESSQSGSCNTNLCPVDGQWSAWTAWSLCSVTCGGGTHTKNRVCEFDPVAPHGANCVGDSKQSGTCSTGPCPVDGLWTSWAAWSTCSVSCGGGTQTRQRSCAYPPNIPHGNDCTGENTQSGSCNNNSCPVDGQWTTWSVWSRCSVSCGNGTHTRQRTCSFPAGMPRGDNCVGSNSQSESCYAGYCPVDGQWMSWTAWSSCSVSCGGGTHTRQRTCTFEAGKPHGNNCVGVNSQSESCNNNSCPVDGVWNSWTAWSSCSVTCGGGTHTRQRSCAFAPGHPHGANCVGASSQSGSCNNDSCPVDGQWTSWSVWTSCSVTCGGGTHTRQRVCSFTAGHPHGANCFGPTTQSGSCNNDSCPVDGQWTSWSVWSTCSVTCGGGTHTRQRVCSFTAGHPHGANCVGPTKQSGSCNNDSCPVDGHWTSWAAWSSCTVTCGGGTHTRHRSCAYAAGHPHGNACPGSNTQSGSCNSNHCPVDGHWASWAAWGSCSVTCALGIKSRNRTCTSPAPAYGGSDCAGSYHSSATCNPGPCPVDGHWTHWSAWSACSTTCAAGTKIRTRKCANPAPLYGGHNCAGASSQKGSCNLRHCPVDGQWAAWQAWGKCSVSCSDGTRTRSRTCTNPAPAYNGANCDGSLAQTGHCNLGHCPINGQWGAWSAYGACSVTCESGQRTRTRKCDHPPPQYNGHLCPGSASSQTACHLSACIVDVTGTPYQFLGVGYNILTGNPETKDPGLLSTHRIFQLTGTMANIREATYEKYSTCTPTKTTALLHGSKAYQDELKNLIRPDASHNSHLLNAAFTYNQQFETIRNNLDNKDVIYLDKVTTCALGSLSYNSGGSSSVPGSFAVSTEFARALCALPMDLTAASSAKYMQFLDTWGTSIVSSIEVGTKTTDRYTATPAQVYEHVQKTDTNLLEPSGPFLDYNSSVVINTHDYTYSHSAAGTFGTKSTTNLGTSQQLVPVGGEVVSITDALNPKYWQAVIDGFVKDGVCGSTIKGDGLQNYADSLHMALGQYANYKDSQTGYNYSNTQLLDRHNIQIPISWPVGTYGLMQSVAGCPGGNVAWSSGYVRQDTEDSTHHNAFSTAVKTSLRGDFLTTYITTYFCMKTRTHSSTGSQYDHSWPAGQYCILKKGTCPSGFSEGFIFWDDENTNNGNRHGGTLPDGTFDTNTKIYYCCRHDGSPTSPILLPVDTQFILVRYGSRCQVVTGMAAREAYIVWDDQSTSNKDTAGGVHPLDDGGTGDHKLHFCHYIPNIAGSPAFIG